MTTITHRELAARILDELRATMGPITSNHLHRDVGVDDVLDAVHVATDDMVDGIEIRS